VSAAQTERSLSEALPEATGPCPSCGGFELETFYLQEDIPVHSVRLMQTRDEAVAFPRGALRLALCRSCGFITNSAYDPAPQDYAISYEETQGFSPTFREWADGLAKRWVDRYELQGKQVLEIGCGKGEFLVSMVEHGVAKGIGIDPSFVPERLASLAGERVHVIQDFYSERHSELVGDAVVCRHTLEHIHNTGELMGLVRRSLAGRPDVPVLFELPDVLRVLQEVAFWDIYYEHCSYFTPGSLARLYRSSGFEVLDLALEFDGQYILIEGRAADEPDLTPHPLEETVDEVAETVSRFVRGFEDTRARWRERLRSARADGRRAVIWGGGSKGVAFLTTLGVADEIEYVVDVNPYKQGKFMPGTGHEVIAPELLRAYQPDLVIAMNPVYLDEIGASLSSLGVQAELVGA
jgi:SAM-dependent methyltransferase